jgi:hypothetical protein
MTEKPDETKETKETMETMVAAETTSVEAPVEETIQPLEPTKSFFIALSVLLLVLGGIFLIPHIFQDQGPQTLSDLHGAVVADGIDSDVAYAYNGYSFVYYDDLWYTQVKNQLGGELYDIPLHYGPHDLTDITVTGSLNDYFLNLGTNDIPGDYVLRTYLTFDPEDENLGYVALATGELTQNLATTFGVAFIPACTQEGSGCEGVPIITCDSTDAPVIYLTSGSPTIVYADDNCITLQGDREELVRAVDRFVLKLYNVMI